MAGIYFHRTGSRSNPRAALSPQDPPSRAAITAQFPSQVPSPLPGAHPSFRRAPRVGSTWYIKSGRVRGRDPPPRSLAPQPTAHLSERPSSRHQPWLLARILFPAAPSAPLPPDLHGKCSFSRAFSETRAPVVATPCTLNPSPTLQLSERIPSSPEASSPQS